MRDRCTVVLAAPITLPRFRKFRVRLDFGSVFGFSEVLGLVSVLHGSVLSLLVWCVGR